MIKIFFASLFMLFFAACSSYDDTKRIPTFTDDISDTMSWYDDMKDEVLQVHISIANPNSSGYTLEDVDNDTDPLDSFEPYLNVVISTDSFAAGVTTPNAEFKQKGKSTRDAPQKSYRVKLFSDTDLLQSQKTYQFNKHYFDYSRVRNKLMMDVIKDIPNIPSLKTQFIHLDINGTDYGLFTHVENVGYEYLVNRGWGKEDNLFKAQNFSFRITPEMALTSNDKPVNKFLYEQTIELQNGSDYAKLHAMLKELDATNDIDGFISKYFNRKNYVTWFATNILTGNLDTVTQNFFLYNPKYSNKYYFIPWDYDGAGNEFDSYGKPNASLGNWWDVPLHKKFLSLKKNRDELDVMIAYLRANYITPEIYQVKLDRYRPLIEPILTAEPDLYEIDTNVWLDDFNDVPNNIDKNLNRHYGEMGVSMPFWQEIEYDGSNIIFNWSDSVDFEGDLITYDLLFADNLDFTSPLVDIKNLTPTTYTTTMTLTPGTYYMKVIARDLAKDQNLSTSYQVAYDVVYANKTYYFGVFEFEVR